MPRSGSAKTWWASGRCGKMRLPVPPLHLRPGRSSCRWTLEPPCECRSRRGRTPSPSLLLAIRRMASCCGLRYLEQLEVAVDPARVEALLGGRPGGLAVGAEQVTRPLAEELLCDAPVGGLPGRHEPVQLRSGQGEHGAGVHLTEADDVPVVPEQAGPLALVHDPVDVEDPQHLDRLGAEALVAGSVWRAPPRRRDVGRVQEVLDQGPARPSAPARSVVRRMRQARPRHDVSRRW